MNSDPHRAQAARERVIAMLARLPVQLGGAWSLDNADHPDWQAWRAAEDLAVTLHIGGREFTFFHSLNTDKSAALVIECRCSFVPHLSFVECYRQLLATNHRNYPTSPSTYALNHSTNAVVYNTSYLLESLDAEKLVDALVDGARNAMHWQEQFALTSTFDAVESNFPLPIEI